VGLLVALVAVLIVLSAFFSASETALMSLNRYRLRHQARAGHRGARVAERLLQRPDRLIGVILLGNTATNLAAATIATIIALRVVGSEWGLLVGTIVLTVVVLIFAEVAPKTLAALNPPRYALPSALVYYVLLKIAYPVVWVINLFTNGLLRLLGVRPDQIASHSLSAEELRTVVAEAGVMVPRRHQRMLLSILDLDAVTVDDVRGFMVEMAPRRPAGIGNVVWSLKRFFAFLNAAGLSDVRVDGLLAHAAPRRVRALPCFTREETGRLLEGIETGTPCGKRDYAMVVLAVSTGLRCCDIVALRLDEIDWHRDEIRLVQAKTSRPLVLPLSALAGNAVAEWILHGRPDCDAPEVFVRLKAPLVKLGNSTGSTLMRRRLARAGVDHAARDGKSFHALRRTTGTRLKTGRVASDASWQRIGQIA